MHRVKAGQDATVDDPLLFETPPRGRQQKSEGAERRKATGRARFLSVPPPSHPGPPTLGPGVRHDNLKRSCVPLLCAPHSGVASTLRCLPHHLSSVGSIWEAQHTDPRDSRLDTEGAWRMPPCCRAKVTLGTWTWCQTQQTTFRVRAVAIHAGRFPLLAVACPSEALRQSPHEASQGNAYVCILLTPLSGTIPPSPLSHRSTKHGPPTEVEPYSSPTKVLEPFRTYAGRPQSTLARRYSPTMSAFSRAGSRPETRTAKGAVVARTAASGTCRPFLASQTCHSKEQEPGCGKPSPSAYALHRSAALAPSPLRIHWYRRLKMLGSANPYGALCQAHWPTYPRRAQCRGRRNETQPRHGEPSHTTERRQWSHAPSPSVSLMRLRKIRMSHERPSPCACRTPSLVMGFTWVTLSPKATDQHEKAAHGIVVLRVAPPPSATASEY